MTKEAKEILRVLPTLLREDPAFQLELWKVFSQEFVSRNDLRVAIEAFGRGTEEARRRFDEADRRFDGLLKELRDLRDENNRRFEAMDKRFEAMILELRGGREETRQEFRDLKKWVTTVVGGFQNRAGESLEETVAGTLRIALDMTGVDPAKIHLRQKVVDVNGMVGRAGREYEIDIVAMDSEPWIFEVKSVAELEDVERFNDKAELAIATIPTPGARKALITLDRSAEVEAACQRLGIVLG